MLTLFGEPIKHKDIFLYISKTILTYSYSEIYCISNIIISNFSDGGKQWFLVDQDTASKYILVHVRPVEDKNLQSQRWKSSVLPSTSPLTLL